MSDVEKYNFDMEFDERGAVLQSATIKKRFTLEEVEQIKAQVYAEGEASATARATEALAQAVQQTALSTNALLERLDHEALTLKIQAFDLSLMAAKKLAAYALTQYPDEEIKVLVEECLHNLPQTPRLTVTVAEDIHQDVSEHINRVAEEQNFAGRIITNPATDLPAGDCRIEWIDGGLSRDRADLEASLDEIINRRLQAEAADLGQLDLFADVPETNQ